MHINRKGNQEICKENHFLIDNDDILYFTFNGLENT